MAYKYNNKYLKLNGASLSKPASLAVGYPTGLAAQEINDTSVILMWNEPAHTNPLVNFQIYKDGVLEATITDTLETSYDVTGLTASTLYEFTMTAEDDQANVSSISPPLSITTIATQVNTPVAVFQFDGASTGNSPLSIAVTSFSNTNNSSSISEHHWIWGDGTTTTGGFAAVGKTYNTPGTYSVQLRITVDSVQYFSETQDVIVTSAVADTEAPTTPGKPAGSSATSTSNTISFAAGTDNIGIDRYNIFAETDTNEAATVSEIHLGGLDSTTLNGSGNLIKTTYNLAATEMEDDPNGVRLKLSVTEDYPANVDDRQELRETDISTTPANDTTIEYDVIFTLEDMPTTVYEVFTLMQLFDHTDGAPKWNVHITGANQFGESGDENLLQIYETFSNTRTKIAGTYLKAINHLKAIQYFNSTGGYVAWFLNGEKLLEVTGQDTSPSGATAVQFGIYPHGYQDSASGRTDQWNAGVNERDFSFLVHSFTKRVFTGAIPISAFNTYDFTSSPTFTASGTSGSHIGLNADSTYRYAVQSQDLAGNKSAPSLQGSAKTQAQGNPSTAVYPAGAVVNVRLDAANRVINGSTVEDLSGNGNHLTYNGTLTDEGITASGSFTPQSWPAFGAEATFVEVTRYNNQGSTKVYQFDGTGKSMWFDQKYLGIKANTNGNFQTETGFYASSQPSWYHVHVVVFKSNGDIELHRSMLEPTSGWETNTNTQEDHRDLYQGRSIQSIAIESGNSLRHIMQYPTALSGQDLADLKAALINDHLSPHTGGAFPDVTGWTLQAQTFFENVTDPAGEARGPNMLNSAGGVKLDRTTSETYTDRNGVSRPCLKMQFDNSHGGWGKGQRMMNLNSDQNGLHEDVIIEFDYCVTDLDLNTSLGAKMMPSISFGGVPPPCQPIPWNEGYISGMHRPVRRNLISGDNTVEGAVVHTYNYFQGALDPCGQHMHSYNSDGSFFLLQDNTWHKFRIRLKLNDIGQANGIYQTQIDGVTTQTDSNIEMRNDASVKLQKLTCELFSGGSWSWNGSGHVRIGNIKFYIP